MSLAPVAEGLLVVQVDGDVQALRGQVEVLGHELPGPGDGVFLEVVADAEVTQHLEEGQVLVVAHLVHVGGAEALLAGGEALGGGCSLPHEVGLELDHAGAGEEEGLVPRGDQG